MEKKNRDVIRLLRTHAVLIGETVHTYFIFHDG